MFKVRLALGEGQRGRNGLVVSLRAKVGETRCLGRARTKIWGSIQERRAPSGSLAWRCYLTVAPNQVCYLIDPFAMTRSARQAAGPLLGGHAAGGPAVSLLMPTTRRKGLARSFPIRTDSPLPMQPSRKSRNLFAAR